MLLGAIIGINASLVVLRIFLTIFHSGASISSWILTSIDSLIALSTSTAICLCLYRFVKRKFPDTQELLPHFVTLIWLMILASYFTLRYASDYQTALSILVTGVLICMGWWIQSITTAAQSRRKHTLEVILSTRTSQEYQLMLRKYTHVYHGNKHVSQKFAQWRSFPSSPEFVNADVPKNYRNAINGLLFVLNYFEFLAQGVKANDLDDCLLRECFCGFIQTLEKRAFHIILEAQKADPRHFEGIVYLSKKWNGESIVEKYKSSPQNVDLGVPIPSVEETNKFLFDGKCE